MDTASYFLAKSCTVPAFSVLDPSQEYWVNRRQAWLEYLGGSYDVTYSPQTFDPPLFELIFQWWCKPGGVILDPMARHPFVGAITSLSGFKYWGGCKTREQCHSFEQQYRKIKGGRFRPMWDFDSTLDNAPAADFLFTSLPVPKLDYFFDHSRQPSSNNISKNLGEFSESIQVCAERLRNNRFACMLAASHRDTDDGTLNRSDCDAIDSFEEAGLGLYNEVIVLQSPKLEDIKLKIGPGRKLIPLHLKLLVFIKGDPEIAAKDIRVYGGKVTLDEFMEYGTDALSVVEGKS